MLRSIELNGFKSFANKTKLSFDAPISAIVGPNGSGKSNAAEAFRFVLGEQSMKALRSKKTEDLLFNGSRQVRRANRAHVRATFDNSNDVLDLDYDEVAIERIVHRDASADYRLNGDSVRLKDITELLAQANIGSNGHHIISQGEADMILNVNERERKSIIEDALGLRIYQQKKRRAIRKLERTEDNLSDIKDLKRELTPRLNYLKKEKEKLDEAQSLESALKHDAKRYFKHESSALKAKAQSYKEQLAEPKQKLHEIREKLEQLRHVEDAEGGLEDSEEMKALNRKLHNIKQERHELNEEYEGIISQLSRIAGELSAEERLRKRQSSSSDATIAVTRDRLQGIRAKLQSLIDEPEQDWHHVISNTLGELSQLLDSTQQNSSESIEDINNRINELQNKEAKLEKQKQNVQTKKQEVNDKLSELESKQEILKEQENESEKNQLKLEVKERELASKVSEISHKLERVEEHQERLREDIAEMAAVVGVDVRHFDDVEVGEGQGIPARRQLERQKIKLEEMNLGDRKQITDEYEEVSERVQFLEGEIADLVDSKESLERVIVELEETLEEKFREGLKQINQEFQRFFALMFGGGQAKLSITKHTPGRADDDPDDYDEEELEYGVKVHVSLPRKNIKGLAVLSGGERALTSIALLFAISQINPPPFIILDETDAALDEANSRRYGDMIENLSEKSQLILITHNRETMSRADTLYGVTMGADGVSKLLSIEFSDAVAVAK